MQETRKLYEKPYWVRLMWMIFNIVAIDTSFDIYLWTKMYLIVYYSLQAAMSGRIKIDSLQIALV